MANPPFLERGRAVTAAAAGKAEATVEGEADLAAWVRFALAMVRAKGTVTFIHRADRIDALLARLAGGPAKSWSFRCGRGWASRQAGSSCGPASRSRRRRGSPPGSSCMNPTGGLHRRRRGVLREGRGARPDGAVA